MEACLHCVPVEGVRVSECNPVPIQKDKKGKMEDCCWFPTGHVWFLLSFPSFPKVTGTVDAVSIFKHPSVWPFEQDQWKYQSLAARITGYELLLC